MIEHDTLLAWENFVALVAESDARADAGEVDAFGTPTIVHFCAVLLVSAIISAPWPALWQVAIAIEICGVSGIAYTLIVIRRTRRTKNYKAELEDWIWHAVLPLLGYLTLFGGAVALPLRTVPALFGIGVFALLLLFVGIHNAWDTVTYITVGMKQSQLPPKTE